MGSLVSAGKTSKYERMVASPRAPETAVGGWAPLSRSPRSQCAPPEVLLSSPDTLETSPWGAAPARRRWRRKPRPLPPPASLLWVAGDGGAWEENYRYHRLAGSLVSSAEPMEEFRPLIHREAPRGQAQGPPLPRRDLASAQMLGEGHFMLHLPP
ncbi:anionic trypsin-1-like [Platysternon megacephalum]|uniref:Anionic trypsin-1-like n=1 Tax=Platysternon megacephalum TaxID=55544 RepID=A0A4D9DNF5_9SAUR|nr:anionic trypsin-1-like [Platysternon megacephalum]